MTLTPEQIRAVAGKATQAEWRYESAYDGGVSAAGDLARFGPFPHRICRTMCPQHSTDRDRQSHENALHIATFDPPAMLEIAGELERLRAALIQAQKSFDLARRHIESNQVVDKDVHGTLCRARDACRQALEGTAP
jgi:hypothetical protein